MIVLLLCIRKVIVCMKLYEILDGNRKEKLFSCIYLWTNMINGKHYVGQTQHFYDRMAHYKNGGATKYLKNAMNKYGIENFEVNILEYVPIEKLDEREQYWIDYYECYEKDNGYNICQFASTTRGYKHSPESIKKMVENRGETIGLCGKDNPMYGKTWDDERKERHSNYLKDKWANDEEYRKNLTEKMIGENNYFYDRHLYGELNGMYGKHHSAETRRKISEANKGKGNPRSMGIVCVETKIVYESMSKAAKSLNTYASAIKLAVDSPNRTCKGYHFKKI